VLSYLVGLAPLGTPFVVENFVQKDLQISRINLAQFIRRLAKMGAIAQATLRKGSSPQTIRVLKRPEDFEFFDYDAVRLVNRERSRKRREMRRISQIPYCTARQREVLFYLCDAAPIGKAFNPYDKLPFKLTASRSNFDEMLARLQKKGAIEIIERPYMRKLIRVLRHPDSYPNPKEKKHG